MSIPAAAHTNHDQTADAPRRPGLVFPDVSGVEHRYVDTGRVRLHVAQAGAGDPVLLVHGWPQHWYAWRHVIPLLASRYRLICPDLRGFGWSEAPAVGYGTADMARDLLALLDTLGIDRAFVIGHDLGGRLGFHLSLLAPERVRAHLALNAMHPYWSVRRLAPHAWRQWWTVFVETPRLGRLVLQRLPAFTRMLFRLGFPISETRSQMTIEPYATSLREPSRARAAEQVQSRFAYHELIPTLLGKYRSTRLSVPTLMLNGTRDFILAPGELGGHEEYTDQIRVRLVIAGHFLPEEQPHLVADTAIAFFASQLERSAG